MAEKISIPITTPEGVFLETHYMYCDKDIEVIPTLQEKTATANGDITPDSGYAGLKKVTVSIPATAYDQFVKVGDDIDCSSLPYDDSYTITSSAPTVVEADNDGGVWRATAKAAGSATITVTETTPDGDVVKGKLTVGVAAKDSLTGTAAASDVASGKTFYNTDAKTKITGTLEEWGYQLSGTWIFNEELNIDSSTSTPSISEQTINFTSNNDQYVAFEFFADGRSDGLGYIKANGICNTAYEGGSFARNKERTVNFGTTPQTVSEEFYTWFIANATKNGSATSGSTPDFTITANGTTELTDLNGKIIRKVPKVLVNVPAPTPTLQEKTATPTTTTQNISPDSGYDGLSNVRISAIQTETKTVTPTTSSQDVTPTSGKYLSKVTVNAIQTETKTVAPSTSVQNITPTSGKYLTKVTVSAVSAISKSITSNGTYTPDSGTYYSSVTVNVPTQGYNRVVQVGDDINVDDLPYDDAYTISSSNISAVTVENDGGVWVASAVGTGTATISVTETTADGDVVKGALTVLVTAKAISAAATIATASEMNSCLIQANVGKVYKFTGTTDDTYTNGDLYEVIAT